MSTYLIINIITHEYGKNPDFATEVVDLPNLKQYIETISKQCLEISYEMKINESGVIVFEKGEDKEQKRIIIQVLALNDYLVDGERNLVNPRVSTPDVTEPSLEDNSQKTEAPSESLNDIIEDDNS